jgi:RecB family exonuclease
METPTNNTPDKPHLSFTQIGLFLRCPRAYEYRYVEGLKTPPSGAMVQSRAWHEAVERNYRQKVETGTDLPLSDMQETFAEAFARAVAAEQPVLDDDETPGGLKDQGVRIVETHHREIAPGVTPMLVEERFRVNLGPDFPFDLVGVWDLIERDGTIADNKAYGKTPSQDDVDKDLQLTAYALAYRTTTRKTEPRLRIDAVVKNKTPKAVQILTTRTNEDCRWFLRLIEDVARAIKLGVFYPNPQGWHCSPKACGFWTRCRRRASA